MKIFIIIVIVMLSSTAIIYIIYFNKSVPTTAVSKIGDVFTAKIGQTFRIENEPIQIKVNKILEDSRCPQDVTCEWIGWVVIELNVTYNNNTQIIQIGNVAGKSVYLPNPYSPNSPIFKDGLVKIDDYQIEFVKVEPNRKLRDKKIKEFDYNFGLIVKKSFK